MKNIFIFFLISNSIVYSQGQFCGSIEYTVESIVAKDSIKNKIKSNNKNNKIYQSFLTSKANFELNLNSKESIYKIKRNTNKLKSDSDKTIKLNFLESFGGGNGKFYNNISTNEILVQKMLFSDLLLVSYKPIKWKLLNESKTIGKYRCFKAISDNDIIVWYTPEIPLRYGPNLYHGPPGLVLEVYISKIRIVATKINYKNEKNCFIQKPKKGILVTEDKYKKMLSEFADENGF